MVVTDILGMVLDYWQSIPRREGCLPSRRQLDPSAIPEALPFVALIEPSEKGSTLKFRLVGTAIAACLPHDPTGQTLFAQDGMEADLRRLAGDVIQRGEIVRGNAWLTPMDGGQVSVPVILLPLSSSGRRVDMVLVVFGLQDGTTAAWNKSFSPTVTVPGRDRRDTCP